MSFALHSTQSGSAPAVTAAWIAAGFSVLTLVITTWMQYIGIRRVSKDTNANVRRQLAEQREQLDRSLAEQREALERTLSEQRDRTFNERFATAADRLGADQPAAVRLAAVHALAGLADDWEKNRQTCVDVLCAYLRMPYLQDPGHDAAEVDRLAFQSAREVRHTVVRVIADHLRAEARWSAVDLDFTEVQFDGADFSNCRFGGRVSFDGAVFSGHAASFAWAAFPGGHVSFDGAVFSSEQVSFYGARFSGGRIYFNGANFSGRRVSFDDAVFSGAQVNFEKTRLSADLVSFDIARFSGAQVYFQQTEFSGSRVQFRGAKFRSGKVSFDHAVFAGQLVDFEAAVFSGTELSFDYVKFSRGQVDFRRVDTSSRPPRFTLSVLPAGLLLPQDWKVPADPDAATRAPDPLE